jgi:hypothetical protein
LPGLPDFSVQRPGGWEPSEADWAAAAEGGVSAVDDGDEESEPEGRDAPGGSEDPGGATGPPRRARIATLLVAVAVILAGIVLLVTGNVAFAFLAALAVGALGWSTKVGPRRE